MPFKHRSLDVIATYQETPAKYPELKGKVAIVTGSSRGIGQAIAIRFAREGMKIVINSRTPETVQATVDSFQQLGVPVIGVPADLGTRACVDLLFDRTLEAVSAVVVLVNNAANLLRKPLFEVTDELLESELQSNIAGPFQLSMRLANHLREQKKPGSIINISSIGSLQAHYPGLPYDMTKAALNMLTMSMGIELAEFNIRVNAIAPGAIQTYEKPPNADERWEAFQNRIPVKRTGHPMEIASVAAFLASDDASYMTATVFPVDGGVMAQITPKGSPI